MPRLTPEERVAILRDEFDRQPPLDPGHDNELATYVPDGGRDLTDEDGPRGQLREDLTKLQDGLKDLAGTVNVLLQMLHYNFPLEDVHKYAIEQDVPCDVERLLFDAATYHENGGAR